MIGTAVQITPLSKERADEAATVLHAGFAQHWPEAWPSHAAALAEVHDALSGTRVALAAVDDDTLLGWIGAGPTDYGDMTWELHPLVVAPALHGRGVGRALVSALLDELRARGVTTVTLGTDDEDAMTSVGGVDLYPDVLDRLRAIEDHAGHPFGFYRRLGFEVVGIVPDASGPGRPDILMAKRLRPWDGGGGANRGAS
jgi:aminoglycoside 6'-N-acetyltransferase I